jgi:hypothetical protein
MVRGTCYGADGDSVAILEAMIIAGEVRIMVL